MNHTILMYDPSSVVLYGPGSHAEGCRCPLHGGPDVFANAPPITAKERKRVRVLLDKLARDFDLKIKPRKSSARRTGKLMR